MPEKESLPLELWRVVLSYLYVNDLCRCAQVCHEWRELVKSLDSTRWKELFLTTKKWRHPNWPTCTKKEPSSWKRTYKTHYVASKQWINRSIEVRCSPFFGAFRRRHDRREYHVGQGREFITIRSAIAVASPFDRIVVHSGIYDEQHFFVLKYPIEICGAGELGDVVIQMAIEQQASTARLANIVIQPGTGLLAQNSPVIMKVATGHIQVDNCILELGHIQVSTPGSVTFRYCNFSNAFVIFRSVGFSRIENCDFKTDDTSAIIVEGMPPISRQRPVSRPAEGWMTSNGTDSLGLEDLYDLSINKNSLTNKNQSRLSKDATPPPYSKKEIVKPRIPVKDSDCQSKRGSQVTIVTNDKNNVPTSVGTELPQHGKYDLDNMSRDIIRSIHGTIIRNNQFSSGKGAVLVRRRGHAWIEGNKIHNLVHGIRCLTGAKIVVLSNRIHDCETSGLFFRERSIGLVAGNYIFSNKEAGVDIRSGSDPIIQHNHIHSGKRSGVVILDRGRGLIRDNDIYDNNEAGVYILYRGNPVVRHNRIWSGRAAGVAITEEGRGNITHNDICGMEWGGVDIRNGGNPVVSNNWIREGHADGIVIGEGGKGIIMDNDIRGNSGCGVWVLTISKPVIYGNRISESGDSGIAFVSNSDLHHDNQQLSSPYLQQDQDQEQLLQPLFYDEDLSSSSNFDDIDHDLEFNGPRPDKNFASAVNNTVFDNAGHGLHFCGNEGLLIRANSIHGNKACGISITKPADITIQDNSISRNEGSGVSIESGATASVHGNGIYGNHKCGLHVSGKGMIKNNDVLSNCLHGIQIFGPGDPYVTHNRVESGTHHGISIMENARGFVEWNDIFESHAPALYHHPECTTHTTNNNIIPIKLAEDVVLCCYDNETEQYKFAPSAGLDPDTPPPRPPVTAKDDKIPRPTASRMSMTSSGAANIVSHFPNCHGRTRFCVIS